MHPDLRSLGHEKLLKFQCQGPKFKMLASAENKKNLNIKAVAFTIQILLGRCTFETEFRLQNYGVTK